MPSYTSSALHRHVQGLQQDAPVLKTKLPASPKGSSNDRDQRVPTEVPPFTVADLRRAIPAHCFVQNHFLSFAYLFVDLAIVAVLFWIATHIDSTFTEASFGKTAVLLRYAAWCTYWFVQGAVMTGLWVIGHECGHGGFSSNPWIGDSVGWVVHSALLVPYFSWKISHRRHHSNTGNLAKDEVFVPPTEDEFDMDNVLWWSAPGRIIQIGMFATIGWFLYLLVNATGRPYPGQKWYNVNHFMPWSPIFSTKERIFIVLSDIGLGLFLYSLYLIAQATSFYAVVHYYVIPYMIVNFWLVTITLLQHTDTILPHYTATEWDWLRGALATIDRSYGWLNIAQHHIQDTHVAHHLFSTIPHYYAEEATEAIKKVIGSYYRYEDLGVMGVPGALWKCYQTCHYVAADKTKDAPKGVMWFHSIDEGRKNRSK